jgi:hypothetical protein
VKNRRLYTGIQTTDMSAGYVRRIEPFAVTEQFYMLGDHGCYCPIFYR